LRAVVPIAPKVPFLKVTCASCGWSHVTRILRRPEGSWLTSNVLDDFRPKGGLRRVEMAHGRLIGI
jgi:hypothetical protein